MSAPIGVVLTLTNRGDSAIAAGVSYPVQRELTVSVTRGDGVTVLPPAEPAEDRKIPLARLAPGETRRWLVYLNRMLTFHRAGDYEIAYRAEIPILPADDRGSTQSLGNATASGSVRLRLTAPSEGAISNAVAEAARRLESDDPQARLEAVEAMAYVTSSASLGVLERALRQPDTAFAAVHAIARNLEPAATDLLLEALRDETVVVVDAALRALEARRVTIEPARLLRVIETRNEMIRYAVAEHLARTEPGSRSSAVLNRLADDRNDAVHRLALATMRRAR